MQAQREMSVCYICNLPIKIDQVVTMVIPKGYLPPMMAHLYCYTTLQRKRRQQQERELLPS